MAAPVTLDDAAFRKKLLAALEKGKRQAATGLVSHIGRSLNVSARVATSGDGRRKAKGKKGRKRGKGWRYEPSKPGEPPRKRTGTLQKSVLAEVTVGADYVTLRVGSNVPYAAPLEFGAPKRKLAARPWLRPALDSYAKKYHETVMRAVSGILNDTVQLVVSRR